MKCDSVQKNPFSMQKWVNIFTFACMVGAEGADPPHPSPFPTYGPVKRPFFTTSLWLNRWVFFMCFLPRFLESLKAPILSERSRISLNHISNINTIPRLKWISHNIRIIELFALYKCIPHPLPASWSHLMEQKYQWNINNFAKYYCHLFHFDLKPSLRLLYSGWFLDALASLKTMLDIEWLIKWVTFSRFQD